MSRRGFFQRAAKWGLGAIGLGAGGVVAGCGRVIGLRPPDDAELPLPEAQGRALVSPDSLYLPHGRRGGWFNPWWPNPGSRWNLLRWKFFYRNPYADARRRAPEVPVLPNDGRYLAQAETSASITWVGHCTFAVKESRDTFLTDPHFGPRALWPRRYQPPGLPIESVPANAFAVISHNHYDHLDAWTVGRLPKTVTWFVPMGLGEWIRRAGGGQVMEMDWWQSRRHGKWKVTCLPAQHWSNRLDMERNATLWCSWLIESDKRKIYCGGDSGFFHGFAEFGRRFGPIDLALLPIGAYHPRWMMRYAHMNPAEAYRAFRDLKARWMVPMHWGTFDLTDEPVDEPPRALRRAVGGAGGNMNDIKLMAIGERWHMPE